MAKDLAELIRRLEGAAGGDRELDAEIAALCHPTDDPQYAAFENGRDYPDLYTTSLDAALTLVPAGWRLYSLGQINEWWEAELGEAANDPPGWAEAQSKAGPALALCIAALRARASMA